MIKRNLFVTCEAISVPRPILQFRSELAAKFATVETQLKWNCSINCVQKSRLRRRQMSTIKKVGKMIVRYMSQKQRERNKKSYSNNSDYLLTFHLPTDIKEKLTRKISTYDNACMYE